MNVTRDPRGMVMDVATRVREMCGFTAEQLARALKAANRYKPKDIMWILKEQRAYPPFEVYQACRLLDYTLEQIVESATVSAIGYSHEELVLGLLDDTDARYALPEIVRLVRRRQASDEQIALVLKKRSELSVREVIQAFFDAGATVEQITTALIRAGGYPPNEILATMKDIASGIGEVLPAFLNAGQKPESVGPLLRQIECTADEVGACYKGKNGKLEELLALLQGHFSEEEIGMALAAADMLVELDPADVTEVIDEKGTPAVEGVARLPTVRPNRPTPVRPPAAPATSKAATGT